jgi:hypothetical protein
MLGVGSSIQIEHEQIGDPVGFCLQFALDFLGADDFVTLIALTDGESGSAFRVVLMDGSVQILLNDAAILDLQKQLVDFR